MSFDETSAATRDDQYPPCYFRAVTGPGGATPGNDVDLLDGADGCPKQPTCAVTLSNVESTPETVTLRGSGNRANPVPITLPPGAMISLRGQFVGVVGTSSANVEMVFHYSETQGY